VATLPDDAAPVRRLVVRTTDFDEVRRTMERVFLPMAMWPLEPLTALDMRLDSTRIDEMVTSVVRFGRHIGLRSVEADSYHVAASMSGVAESGGLLGIRVWSSAIGTSTTGGQTPGADRPDPCAIRTEGRPPSALTRRCPPARPPQEHSFACASPRRRFR
jgi:hypothetical protein